MTSAPSIAFLPHSLSALFLLAWYILSGVRLLRLGRGALDHESAKGTKGAKGASRDGSERMDREPHAKTTVRALRWFRATIR